MPHHPLTAMTKATSEATTAPPAIAPKPSRETAVKSGGKRENLKLFFISVNHQLYHNLKHSILTSSLIQIVLLDFKTPMSHGLIFPSLPWKPSPVPKARSPAGLLSLQQAALRNTLLQEVSFWAFHSELSTNITDRPQVVFLCTTTNFMTTEISSWHRNSKKLVRTSCGGGP